MNFGSLKLKWPTPLDIYILNEYMQHIKKIKVKKEILFLLFIISLFIIIAIVLPVYDSTNGFYNILLDNYKLVWHDGRSPINFYIIKKIIKNEPLSFTKGYLVGDIPAENLYDLSEKKDGKYYPNFWFFSDYLFAGILYFIPFYSDIQLFKLIIFLMIIFSSVALAIFYYIQKHLGLKMKYALISTFISGIATSVLIYSRYLFINELFQTLAFSIFILCLLENFKENNLKNNIILLFSFFILLFSFIEVDIFLIFFLFFSYFFLKYNVFRLKIFWILSISFLIFCIILNFITFGYFFYKPLQITENTINILDFPIFIIYSNYIPSIDYIIYGYHDTSSVWKLERLYSYFLYGFKEIPGNALFLKIYSIFGSLFGAKGFVYNSIYLIFSIFGIFLYKHNKEKGLILWSILLILLIFGLLDPIWYGGVTPRYDRFFTIPALFLTFFSFYYIQETSKEKNKIKKYLIYTIFIILVILSTLNVTSLAIRTDWTYEHEANLVSYDLVLWPWYLPTPTGSIINLYLTELGESVEWKFDGEINGCEAYGNLDGIITSLCDCEYATYAERSINIPWNEIRVNSTACNNNGYSIIGQFYFDDKENELLINPNSCKQESILIENSSGIHNLILKSKKYGECNDETVLWKLITIEGV